MSPGRTSRNTSRSQQEVLAREANVDIAEQEVITHSNTQVVRTTRSTVAQTKHTTITTSLDGKNETISSHVRSGQNVKYKRRKATRGMGTSKIARASSTGKLSVVFYANCRQPICRNAERFNNEIGFIVRNHGTLCYKDWRLVPEEVRAPLRSYLLENFDIDLSDETTRECIDDQMRKAYWEFLCDCWSTEHFKERAIKNSENQAKKKWASKNGSVSTPRHHIRRPDLEDLYDDMMTLRENFTPEEKSDIQIMERVLGRHSVYLRG
ncbi:hypothetical protein POM88_041583 [Heracleum sosnowskyi]|uniref:Uncharacterized protein n=1 Tax=Heracleum sosnowskyi TaxID=360622 RepID=A0AAD8HEJ2_9APIA|nr:hypothetical protein POM88_041583 [Heracleum sosnowskyi]